ncbi:MAG: hypothetical protein INR71_10300 [Terriglobus roseus]|nr:hypothetical protein [Terriglobus roseus]
MPDAGKESTTTITSKDLALPGLADNFVPKQTGVTVIFAAEFTVGTRYGQVLQRQ